MSRFVQSRRWFLGLLLGALFGASAWAGAIDVNTADAQALTSLNGIGPAKARSIVDYREANGPFEAVEDLVKVNGIGPKLLERLRPQLRLGDDAAEDGGGE